MYKWNDENQGKDKGILLFWMNAAHVTSPSLTLFTATTLEKVQSIFHQKYSDCKIKIVLPIHSIVVLLCSVQNEVAGVFKSVVAINWSK